MAAVGKPELSGYLAQTLIGVPQTGFYQGQAIAIDVFLKAFARFTLEELAYIGL